jgi:hypothetical protein
VFQVVDWVASAEASALAEAKDVADIVGTAVTSIAVVVGAFWAYFKFIKGRTFRPHVEVNQSGEWLGANGALGFKATVSLKNIGAAKVELRQAGTGLRISRLADDQPEPPGESLWESFGVFEIFTKHEWIEPGETVGDELLVRLPLDPQPLQLETRLVLPWKKRVVLGHVGQTEVALPWTHDRNVSIHTRQIVVSPPSDTSDMPSKTNRGSADRRTGPSEATP